MSYNLISPKTIIQDYLSMTGNPDSIDEVELLKITSDLANKNIQHQALEYKVALLDVTNHSAELPIGFHSAVQIAFRDIEDCKPKKRYDVKQWVGRLNESCDITVDVNCDKCYKPNDKCTCGDSPTLEINVDKLWLQSHPQYMMGHVPHLLRWGGVGNQDDIPYRSAYHREFYLIKPAQHSFHNADYWVGGCLNLDKRLQSAVSVEYTITNTSPRKIRVNREGGQILIAYFGQIKDEDDWIMIPDVAEFREAAVWKIEEILSYKEWRKDSKNNGLAARYKNATERYLNAIKAFRDKQIPSYNEFSAFWTNIIQKKYDNFNSDYNFRKQEDDLYNRFR